jgi:integrase
LIKPLEDYVHNYRQILVGDKATETLYVGEQGAPLNSTSIRFLICELALSYGGKRLTPHIFRDIFAFEYLKNRPLDFVTLSIQLWHASVNTTMKYYAGRFNASCGTAAVESWLEQRRAKYNSLPGTVSKTVPGSAHTGALTNNSVVRHHNRQRSMK